MKRILFLILILSASITFAKDAKFDSLVTTGIRQIYNIKFPAAEKTFRELIADYPNHPAGRFFLAMIDWWKILLNPGDESHDDMFFQKLEDVINQCDELLDNNPNNVDALFFKGGAIGFRGRLRANRDSWIKAADDGREALPIVEEASKLDSTNTDVELGFGIYNYYAAVIPEEYPMIKPLMIFFPSGDKQKGIEQLNNTAQNGKYAKYEAQYFLMTLYFEYEKNPYQADVYAKTLTNEFPDNPIFERWHGRIAAKRGDMVLSSIVFKDYLMKSEKKYPGYQYKKGTREASYYVGLQYKNINKFDSSLIYFQKCEKLSREVDGDEETGFLINSTLYLGMLNDVLGNRGKAVEYYNDVLDMKEYGRSHALANEYIKTPFKN